MRPRKTEAEKKRLGRPSYRTFYNRIGFQVSEEIHVEINNIAQERKVRFEDIYAEAVNYLLSIRKKDSIIYTPAPMRPFARRVTIHMEPSLEEAVRAACQEDQHRLVTFSRQSLGSTSSISIASLKRKMATESAVSLALPADLCLSAPGGELSWTTRIRRLKQITSAVTAPGSPG